MSIAGGDPLVHPEIVEIVRMISQGGWKPILNTNGLALTPSLLRRLKRAGVYGFTFHIDTTQTRHDNAAMKEVDHNSLRMKFAKMLDEEGGISCSFNQTVSENTYGEIPEIVKWASNYPGIIQTMVFILYREPAMTPQFDHYVGGKKIDMSESYSDTGWGGSKILKAQDIVDKIREEQPAFEPSAYLNGTVDPDSMKWLIGMRVAQKDKTLGYVSANFMRAVQHFSHFFRSKWLSYSNPAMMAAGKMTMAIFFLWDKEMRKSAWNFFKHVLKNPLNLFRTVHLQAFTIIQPIDYMEDGRMNMCDGCPDITVHEGELYWSCRLEEIKEYGTFFTAAPKTEGDLAKMDVGISAPAKSEPQETTLQ